MGRGSGNEGTNKKIAVTQCVEIFRGCIDPRRPGTHIVGPWVTDNI